MDKRSKNKVKLFRTLKVVFYALGLPLFMFAVIITAATEYVGEFAYNGLAATEQFASMKVLFNGTALYGVWIAAGIWLLIAILHIIMTKTVKNRRARTLLVGIVTLVVMIVPVVIMDLVIPIRLDAIAADLPEGVTIASYADEKGHFYTRTSASWTPSGKYESNNYYFITDVENFLKTYNIGLGGGTKSGTANNTSNDPVRLGELYIDGEGAVFENEPFANKVVEADSTITATDPETGVTATAEISSNANGELVVNGKTFPGYYLGATNGVWYRTSAAAEMKDGVYGYASYNSNGLLSDGYVYGIDVVLEILEDYYYSQKKMTELSNAALLGEYGEGATLPSDDQIRQAAQEALEAYYGTGGKASDYEKWLYGRSVDIGANFSLTQDELKQVLNALGVGLTGALEGVLNTVLGFVGKPNEDGVYEIAAGDVTISISVGPTEFSDGEDVLTIAISGIGGSTEKYELGLDSRLIGGLSELLDSLVKTVVRIPADPTTGQEEVLYNSVAEIVYDVLNGGGSGTIGTVGTVFGIVSGLISIIGDITDLITIETDGNGNVTTTTEDMLYGLITNLLSALYWYSDSEIKPAYDFYVEGLASLGIDVTDEEDALAQAAKEYAEQLASYDRAVYEGGMHGYVIGSVLIPGSSLIAGDTLGNGSYSATVPASYEEVMLFKTELSYKKWLYPLLGVRECLVCFMPFVVLFILLSGAAAEKEMLYATGIESAKSKKNKKDKDADAADDGVADAAVTEDVVLEEGTEPLAAAENDKEVL